MTEAKPVRIQRVDFFRDSTAARSASIADTYKHAAKLAAENFASYRLRARLRGLMRVFALEAVRYARATKELERIAL